MQILNMPIAGAVAAQVGAISQVAEPYRSLLIQGRFVYGSGGLTVDAWVQTSIDGLNWWDICNFHFTTASARFLYNLSALTAVAAEYTATDGTLAANTAKDGLLGNLFRVKYATTGTYVGSSLFIDMLQSSVRFLPN